MNNLIVDCLYDYAVTLTYEAHESGHIDYKKFLDNFFENQEIDNHLKKTFEDYTNFYLNNNCGWFPDREEIADWYFNYKKVKV